MKNKDNLENFLERFNINLNTQQKSALENLEGRTLLLAVPGSGKTTVIISRLGYMILEKHINPESILTLTFSKAGVNDLKKRFLDFFGQEIRLPKISTIHSFAFSVIRTCQRQTGRKAFEVLDNRKPLIRDIFKKVLKEFPTENDIGEFENKITYSKNLMLKKEENKRLFGKQYKAYETFEKYKDQNNLIDFDDMLIYAYRLLKKNPQLLRMYQDQFKYIQVDEAQDNSRVQHALIKLLVGDRGNLFMVADEDQTIYGFRGAFITGITKFRNHYPGSNILQMETNYRSSEALVEPANNFIHLNDGRYKKKMVSGNNRGIPAFQEYFKSVYDRDEYIITSARKEGKEIAVLFRNNDSAVTIVDLLDKKNIPFSLKESNPSFFSNALMRDILNFYKFAKNPNDVKSFRQIWYKINIKLSKENMKDFEQELNLTQGTVWQALSRIEAPSWLQKEIKRIKEAFDVLAKAKPIEFLNIFQYDLGYMEYLEYSIKSGAVRDNYAKKLDILKTLARREETMKSYFNRLVSLKQIMNNPELPKKSGCITLSTIHAAKGLEFEKVFLIDVTDSTLPAISSEEDMNKKYQELLEEVRLFYVGVTRAKHELAFLSIGSKESQPPGQKVSPFIDFYYHPEKIQDELKRIKDKTSKLLN